MSNQLRDAVREAIQILYTEPMARVAANKVEGLLVAALGNDLASLAATQAGPHDPIVTDAMVDAALRQHYGGSKWHDDYRRQMRETLRVALQPAPPNEAINEQAATARTEQCKCSACKEAMKLGLEALSAMKPDSWRDKELQGLAWDALKAALAEASVVKQRMTTARAAMQATLEALTELEGYSRSAVADKIARDAKQALRAALAEPCVAPAEPVAWRWLYDGKPDGSNVCFDGSGPDADIIERAKDSPFPRTVQYLWDGPPARRGWVPLTDEEILGAYWSAAPAWDRHLTGLRAVEQTLKERNA